MKKNLGRVYLLLLLFLNVNIFASAYEWSAAINKTTAYVNEAVHIKYICKFSDSSELYTIDFNPVGDYEKFSLKPLSQSEKIVDGRRINSYEFVAFAKVAGKINFDFEMVMKHTTKESVENTVIGRDNVQKEEFDKKILRQKILELDVKESSGGLVGEFSVEVKKDKQHVKAYEPYHMEIVIKGDGYFDNIKPIEFKIEGVKVFAGEVQKNIKLNENGYTGALSQKFVFVGSESFKIPRLKVEYFSIVQNKMQNLLIEETDVNVTKGYVKEELLDAQESGYEIEYDYFYYLLSFVAGFLLSKVKLKKHKSLKSDKILFNQKIDDAKSLKELMVLLALKDSKVYEKIIFDIEEKKVTSLKKAKKISKLI